MKVPSSMHGLFLMSDKWFFLKFEVESISLNQDYCELIWHILFVAPHFDRIIPCICLLYIGRLYNLVNWMKMHFLFAQHYQINNYALNAMNNILYQTYYRLILDERPWLQLARRHPLRMPITYVPYIAYIICYSCPQLWRNDGGNDLINMGEIRLNALPPAMDHYCRQLERKRNTNKLEVVSNFLPGISTTLIFIYK